MKRLLLIPLVLFLACEDKQQKDCAGVEGGTAVFDNCDNCVGGDTGEIACTQDCANVWGGTATVDNCDQCVSGNTGEIACTQDCNGDWGGSSINDIDGNCYETVIIGEQEWMAENLKVTHYRNGDEIPTGLMDSEWTNLSTGAYAVYGNPDTYGYLYNWYAVDDDRGVCPDGWHVPTDGEYTVLSNYLGGTNIAGGKMKECTEGSCPDSEYWNSPNTGATNESGFTGLPGGYRFYYSGFYDGMGYYGYFWSSTEYSNSNAWKRGLDYYYSEVYHSSSSKRYGLSVRCLKD